MNTPSKIRVHHNKTSMLRQKTGSHESLNSIGASSIASRMTSATGGGMRYAVGGGEEREREETPHREERPPTRPS